MIEHIVGDRLLITPHLQNSPSGLLYAPHRTRLTPERCQLQPVAYTRCLVIGRLHRTHQLVPDSGVHLFQSVWGLIHELRAEPNCYCWRTFWKGTKGVRLPWAVPALNLTRSFIRYFAKIDHEILQ